MTDDVAEAAALAAQDAGAVQGEVGEAGAGVGGGGERSGGGKRGIPVSGLRVGPDAHPAPALDFAVYTAFFPYLLAGPIARAREFLPQLTSPRNPHTGVPLARDPAVAFLQIQNPSGEVVGAYVANSTGDSLTYLTDLLASTTPRTAFAGPWQDMRSSWGTLAWVLTSANITNTALQLKADNNGAGAFTGGHASNSLAVTTFYLIL